MSIIINMPRLTGATPEAQVGELKSFVYQLVGQLNYELNNLEKQVSELKENANGVHSEQDSE